MDHWESMAVNLYASGYDIPHVGILLLLYQYVCMYVRGSVTFLYSFKGYVILPITSDVCTI